MTKKEKERKQEREDLRHERAVGQLLNELDELGDYYRRIIQKLGTIVDKFHKEGLYRLDTSHDLPRILRKELKLRGFWISPAQADSTTINLFD